MMKGFYLYCIRFCAKSSRKNNRQVAGIDGNEIFTISYKDLEAVVSEISVKEFNSEEIQKKAQEDLEWIKNQAYVHERVIEKAMGLQSFPWRQDPLKNKGLKAVIPMKFGTIFKSREKLEEIFKRHYSKFKENLKNLRGKQEWAVKVYLNRKVFEGEVKKVSLVVLKKEKEIAQLPEGMAYFMQKQIDDVISREANKALQDYGEIFFETLKKYAETGTKGKILEKELTGKSLPMVLNTIFLILEKKIEDFIKEIDKLSQKYKSKGFNFEYSGPWPPYTFI